MNRSDFAGLLGTALLAPTVFALAGTNVASLREQARDPVKRTHLRIGQYTGVTAVLGVGLVSSSLAKDNLPLVGAVIGAAGMFAIYEYALRNPAPQDQDKAQAVTQAEPRTVLVY